MACKTVLRQLLSKYGVMTVEFANIMAQDQDERTEAEVSANANAEPLMLPDKQEPIEAPAAVSEPVQAEAEKAEALAEEPDF